MNIIDQICKIAVAAFTVFTLYRYLYIFIGIFTKKKSVEKSGVMHKIAVIICARNESAVISKAVESIKKQNYPQDKLTVFVMADNCTDNTAELAKNAGAIAYERFNNEKIRKGYALEELFTHIERDYGTQGFDAYIIMDADNLLCPDFVSSMNDWFSKGHKVVTGYRNTKNFTDGIISSSYGIHFLRNNYMYHRVRNTFNLGTHLTGTGYMFSSEFVKDGWHFTNLTEDDEFTSVLIGSGVKVAFCEDAEFYDEQPTDFKTMFRQRTRWARGRLVNFVKNFGKLFKAMFKFPGLTTYDLFWHYFPVSVATWILGIIYPVISCVYNIINNIPVNPVIWLETILEALAMSYAYGIVTGIITVIKERKHIKCGNGKLAWYVFLSPWFLMTDIIIILVAMFTDIKWKKIDHKDSRGIDDM